MKQKIIHAWYEQEIRDSTSEAGFLFVLTDHNKIYFTRPEYSNGERRFGFCWHEVEVPELPEVSND